MDGKKEPRGSFFYFRGDDGFTVMELVTVIIILSVLAVIALPKFWGSVFDQATAYQQTLGALRYAQRTAAAYQRTVCVYFTANTVTLGYRSTYGDTACNAGTDAALIPPGGGAAPYQVATPGGVTLGFTSANFYFDLLGRPSGAQTITVSGMSPITVEAESGYVH